METSRNLTAGFAKRTRKNIEVIEQAYNDCQEGHVVTQLVNSLLGLIVVPWERNAAFFHDRLGVLEAQGWPRIEVTKGKCDTLGQLVENLRHAVAHGHFGFSSESRSVDEVVIAFSNRGWRAEIKAQDLKRLCSKLCERLET